MDAMKLLLQKATGKYFVVIEEDMIWFQDDWLKNLVLGSKLAKEQDPKVVGVGGANIPPGKTKFLQAALFAS